MDKNVIKYMKKIIIIGDSHSNLFNNDNELHKRGNWNNNQICSYFDINWLGPVTLWRLCRDKENLVDFSKYENGSNIVLNFGEIDIRCHFYKNYGDDYEKHIDLLVNNLYEFLSKYSDQYSIHITSICPPIKSNDCISPNSSLPFIGSDEYRINVTKYLNKKLSSMKNINFFNIYNMYVDVDGTLDIKKSDRIVHCIKTTDFENYVIDYFNLPINKNK